MFEEMMRGLAAEQGKKKMRKAVRDFNNSDILAKLDTTPALPVKNNFKPGDLITQVVVNVEKDGEPNTRYKFPMPGQPAKVVGVIENPDFEEDSCGNKNGHKDLLVQAALANDPSEPNKMVVREYCMCSRYFRLWENGETIDQAVADYIDKADSEEKQD